MNKVCMAVVTLSVAVCLTSCGKTEAAKSADSQIAELAQQEITLESAESISTVEESVNKLSEKEKGSLDNLSELESIRVQYDEQAADAISNVEALISDIGDVTTESNAKITKAQEAYDDLPADLQSRISNYDDLTSAQDDFYRVSAEYVETLINDIGDVTLDSSAKITAAKSAYDGLSADAKALVSNTQALTDAEAKIEHLKTEQEEQKKAEQEARKNSLISSMKVTTDDFKECTFYEPSRMPKYNNSRSCVLPYIGQRYSGHKWLVIRYNYAGDDWVFFTKVTILTDSNRYEKEIDYFDRTTGVGGGTVGELYDEVNTTSADKAMLADMASSAEVKIRFEGSDYYRDITVGDKDKAAIKDVLELYDLL